MEQSKMSRDVNWLPPFRIEYDGQYVSLFGKSKDFPVPVYSDNAESEQDYDEVGLCGALVQQSGIDPQSLKLTFDDDFIYVTYSLTDDH